ncbi:MAG: hypothetical protein Q8867_05045 [Bacteroidota bacterium]|nr:hypothetical protein [Bacteroidota bacterium]
MRNINFVLFILIFVSSCKKEDKYEDYLIPVAPAIKSQEFKIGSYWIFENDSTLKVDSVYVTRVQTGSYLGYQVKFERQWVEYFNIFYGGNLSEGAYDWDHIEKSNIYRNPVQENRIFQGLIIYSTDTSNKTILLDSLKVGKILFKDVQKSSNSKYIFYTAKNIGIIKKTNIDTLSKGSWNLIRWKTVNVQGPVW